MLLALRTDLALAARPFVFLLSSVGSEKNYILLLSEVTMIELDKSGINSWIMGDMTKGKK